MIDHDSIYHRLFSHPGMVVDLLENFLDPTILAELDLSRMTRLNTKFTATTGQRRRGDMVWELPIRTGGSLFVLLILEFQSEIDEWMVLRLHVYAGLLYQQLVDERRLKPADGLPPILPVVLYNGEPRWNAATSLRELIPLPTNSPLWLYQPEIRYHTIDEGRFPEDDL
ncbi:MAG: Rpn family recombination-promoting nuclease/putative transposase, partial [Magnetococcales bacterium]|nr:Rpn family recombination-promoting nuclease/putative transposase [Magnetococcales bacterium]